MIQSKLKTTTTSSSSATTEVTSTESPVIPIEKSNRIVIPKSGGCSGAATVSRNQHVFPQNSSGLQGTSSITTAASKPPSTAIKPSSTLTLIRNSPIFLKPSSIPSKPASSINKDTLIHDVDNNDASETKDTRTSDNNLPVVLKLVNSSAAPLTKPKLILNKTSNVNVLNKCRPITTTSGLRLLPINTIPLKSKQGAKSVQLVQAPNKIVAVQLKPGTHVPSSTSINPDIIKTTTTITSNSKIIIPAVIPRVPYKPSYTITSTATTSTAIPSSSTIHKPSALSSFLNEMKPKDEKKLKQYGSASTVSDTNKTLTVIDKTIEWKPKQYIIGNAKPVQSITTPISATKSFPTTLISPSLTISKPPLNENVKDRFSKPPKPFITIEKMATNETDPLDITIQPQILHEEHQKKLIIPSSSSSSSLNKIQILEKNPSNSTSTSDNCSRQRLIQAKKLTNDITIPSTNKMNVFESDSNDGASQKGNDVNEESNSSCEIIETNSNNSDNDDDNNKLKLVMSQDKKSVKVNDAQIKGKVVNQYRKQQQIQKNQQQQKNSQQQKQLPPSKYAVKKFNYLQTSPRTQRSKSLTTGAGTAMANKTNSNGTVSVSVGYAGNKMNSLPRRRLSLSFEKIVDMNKAETENDNMFKQIRQYGKKIEQVQKQCQQEQRKVQQKVDLTNEFKQGNDLQHLESPQFSPLISIKQEIPDEDEIQIEDEVKIAEQFNDDDKPKFDVDISLLCTENIESSLSAIMGEYMNSNDDELLLNDDYKKDDKIDNVENQNNIKNNMQVINDKDNLNRNKISLINMNDVKKSKILDMNIDDDILNSIVKNDINGPVIEFLKQTSLYNFLNWGNNGIGTTKDYKINFELNNFGLIEVSNKIKIENDGNDDDDDYFHRFDDDNGNDINYDEYNFSIPEPYVDLIVSDNSIKKEVDDDGDVRNDGNIVVQIKKEYDDAVGQIEENVDGCNIIKIKNLTSSLCNAINNKNDYNKNIVVNDPSVINKNVENDNNGKKKIDKKDLPSTSNNINAISNFDIINNRHIIRLCKVCNRSGPSMKFLTPNYCSVDCIEEMYSKKNIGLNTNEIKNVIHNENQKVSIIKKIDEKSDKNNKNDDKHMKITTITVVNPNLNSNKRKLDEKDKDETNNENSNNNDGGKNTDTKNNVNDDKSNNKKAENNNNRNYYKRRKLIMKPEVQDEVQIEFNWDNYIKSNNAQPAPIELFFKTMPSLLNDRKNSVVKNHFKIGMKLEAIDPENHSLFCVCTVAQVQGYRIKLHFDGYSSMYDFWVNANSINIFPPGWCRKTNRRLQPPKGISSTPFNWKLYLRKTKSIPAAPSLFEHVIRKDYCSSNSFQCGMRLEADDLKNTQKVCVASVSDILDDRILVHFDGWDEKYDYWIDIDSPYIHPINWHIEHGYAIVPPPDWNSKFEWEKYLKQIDAKAAPSNIFPRPREPLSFEVGMKLEAVDKKNPSLIRPATVVELYEYDIKILFDGWPEQYAFWVNDDSPDLHPVGWCESTGHDLEPPPGYKTLPIKMPCTVPNCRGIGNAKKLDVEFHANEDSCPYEIKNWKKTTELNDRIEEPSIIMKVVERGKNVKTIKTTKTPRNSALKRPNEDDAKTNVEPDKLLKNQKRVTFKDDKKSVKGKKTKNNGKKTKTNEFATVGNDQKIEKNDDKNVKKDDEIKIKDNVNKIDNDNKMKIDDITSTDDKTKMKMTSENKQIENLTTTENTNKNSKNENKNDKKYDVGASTSKEHNDKDDKFDDDFASSLHITRSLLCDYGPRLKNAYKLWKKNSKHLTKSRKGIEAEVHTNPLKWDCNKVHQFVESIRGCGDKIAQKFIENEIDGLGFLSMRQNDLIKNLSINLGPSIKIYNQIIQLREVYEKKFKKRKPKKN